MSDPKTVTASVCFPTTQWTRVIDVIQGGETKAAAEALSEFCEQYRPAIYQFFIRRGCKHETAEDYTQEFFNSRILRQWETREGFLYAAERIGKFRAFLCSVLWRFLKDEWRRQKSAKGGGKLTPVPLDDLDLADDQDEEKGYRKFGGEFDRVFALQIVQRAADRSKYSKYLQAHLKGEMSQEEAGQKLGLSEKAFKGAYARFRKVLAEDLQSEVSRLVSDKREVREEIRYLMSLFCRGA